jgi:hypothetical protein
MLELITVRYRPSSTSLELWWHFSLVVVHFVCATGVKFKYISISPCACSYSDLFLLFYEYQSWPCQNVMCLALNGGQYARKDHSLFPALNRFNTSIRCPSRVARHNCPLAAGPDCHDVLKIDRATVESSPLQQNAVYRCEDGT